ncbi:N,N-dimethylformamidase beta subunit family domain-containing protein [Bosea sp. UC22_33]|uniref:N,N-dimethylformamidase beta subunit family domain-containing protein n=1 Tax=Bosea sp. UC22_33 TaxID=3350165 RepID=UPI00366DFDB3
MRDTTAVLGYAWPLVVSPGEAVSFHLSSPSLKQAQARIVRVRCADPDPDGPGLKLSEPGTAIDGPVALRDQPIHPGSAAIIADKPALAPASFSVGCFIWPTAPLDGAQTILSRWRGDIAQGWRLGLDEGGHLVFAVAGAAGGAELRSAKAVIEREWLFVTASYDATTGRIGLTQRSLDPQAGRDRSGAREGRAPAALGWPADTALVFAAHALAGGADPLTGAHYDGKIDRPRLYREALPEDAMRRACEMLAPPPADPALVGAWDFTREMAGDSVRDVSTNRLDGRLRHMPMRAMTGANWDGSVVQWRERPEFYGAIHFHRDDMADCGWAPDLTLSVPQDWRSGFYALKLTAREGSDDPVESYVSFFVRTPPGQAKARLALVASTATYLAYANSALRLDQVHAEAMLEGVIALSRDDAYIQEHRELGLSTYDTHSDGSGWCYSTAKRPILNMRPLGNTFNYVNDTHIIDWLEELGFDYDVITDCDIDRHGAQLLEAYACVITPSHPEYYSLNMIEAFDAYQRGGGRHIYLGGNGFYWRIAWHPSEPHQMEIRRGMSGLRTWEGEAGENGLSFTGEPSGLWRTHGRPPQRLVGVGFDAQVFTRSYPYEWLEDARDPRVSWLIEGIDLTKPLGDFGLRGGGAAGLEVDRIEPSLGSSPQILRLATADRLDYGGVPTLEELRTLHRGVMGDQNALVRADLAFFPTAAGGAVFATGSIAWACALTCNGYDNSVSQVTGNVLRRFLDPAPFAGFDDPDR